MAIIHPFRGWLPKIEHADEVASVPYDVISTEEAREMAQNRPNSFLHVIRPEIDLPDNIPFNDDRVYEKGAQNLKELLQSDLYLQDERPSLYLYQLESGDHIQTGLFTCASVQDYDNDVILKHELTRPDKEDDRTRHILTQSAHAEPVMLTFRATEEIRLLIEKTTITRAPYINHEGDDGVIHRIWKVDAPADFVEEFSKVQHLYIADGHHRCKSASRAAEKLRNEQKIFPGEAEFEYFPVVLFPMEEMKILPYNRIIYSASSEQKEKLKKSLNLKKTDQKSPNKQGTATFYFDSTWWIGELPKNDSNNVADTLDVARLQQGVLTPLFGIENPRTDNNISFVGGIRGTSELERLVDSDKADLAISMYPTSIEELLKVSDNNELMPPKSTWFEPKIKSGFIVHTF